MIKQKDFVVSEVKRVLGTRFVSYTTNALLVLSANELELVKESTLHAILSGQVEYGKSNDTLANIKVYARSMVMNHLKKCRELNGNLVYSKSTGETKAIKADPVAPKGIVSTVLPKELQEYVKGLV